MNLLTVGIQLVPIKNIKVETRYRKDLGDLEELAASIKDIGLLHAIGISCEGVLIFGERRLRAVQLNGSSLIECKVFNVLHPLKFEQDENEMREPLRQSERVELARAIAAKYGDRRKGKTHEVADLPHANSGEKTRDIAAREAGFDSTTAYRQASKVVDKGTPVLVEAMDNGTIARNDAAALADEPAKVQKAAVKDVEKGKAKTASAAVAARKPHKEDNPDSDVPSEQEIPKDSDGNPYPAQSLAAVQSVARLIQLERHLREGIELARQIGKEDIGLYLDPTGIEARLSEAKALVLSAHPRHVCKNCGGKDKKCSWCKGHGWQTRGGYKQCPEPQ